MSDATPQSGAHDGTGRPPVSRGNSTMSMIFQLLPKLPLAARVALLHILRISAPSKYLDLTTEVSIAVLRSYLTPSKPMSITHTQKLVNRDPGVKGRIWVSTYTAPACPGIRDLVIRAVSGLQEGEPLSISTLDSFPDSTPVQAEWTGYRPKATEESKPPSLPEQDLYTEMMKDVKTPTTVLYVHGGAYYLMDPCTHRATVKKLAKLTGGRVYSVRYRLAPQHPFPAAVLDALTSYLTLLYPPPGAFHTPVDPSHIVFAGDSAGGNLALALLQTILELNRQASPAASSSQSAPTLSFHGTEITFPLPLPAGVALSSPWVDMTHSSPSCRTNANFDYLPAFKPRSSGPPPCPAWPASPPRKRIYVSDELAAHPLATLLMARSWTGSPPVYICTGWELLADEDRLLAAKLHRDGVRVVFEQYEAMPHCFALIFTKLRESARCFAGWSDFMKEVADDDGDGLLAGKGASRFTTVKARTLEEVPIEVGELAVYGEEEMRRRIVRNWGGAEKVGGLDGTAAKL